VLNVLVSAPVFILVWLWSIKSGIEKQWALGGLGINTASLSAMATPRENSEEPASVSGEASPRVR
jgi:alpha-1,3-glucosyltransferase